MLDVERELDIFKFKTVDLLPIEELREKLLSKKKLIIKYGADPSKPDLHLGHYVCLRKLKDLQELGHEIVFIIGDFTATIGDPSGRSETRPRLSYEEVKENSKTYLDQVYKVLDKDKTVVKYNSEWLKNLDLGDVINLAASYTVARMLERDDFKKRFNEEIPIYIHEFLYPLLQGYDSYAINADVEIGGQDQKFNLIVAREVQKFFGQEPQVILTLPLLVGTDGSKKMSKSYDNYIAFNDDPFNMFGKIMSIPDELILHYYSLVLYLDQKSLEEREKKIKENPRDEKANLAYEIVKIFHGEEKAVEAKENFDRTFRFKEFPKDAPIVWVDRELIDIIDILVMVGIPSKSEAKRLIRQKAVEINGNVITEFDEKIDFTKGDVQLRIGKHRFFRLRKT